MTFYQELQLNQAGSKTLIKASKSKKEKYRHIAVYLFKILLTVAFCTAFVMAFGAVFGEDNNIVGVVMLLCVLSFRYADLGIKNKDAMWAFAVIFAILAVGPRLANSCGLVAECMIHIVCIMAIMILSCHNVLMFNHATLVLGYLLLYGYDVTGQAYLYRLVAIAAGAALTMAVYYRNHRKRTFKRTFKDLFKEVDFQSSRTQWQLRLALAIATALLLAGILHLPRRMWAGIAVMSVTLPFPEEIRGRVGGRIPGNIIGGLVFILIYCFVPKSLHSYIGIFGGIGVGLSATYGWQAVFNSLGAMAIAVSFLGLPGAVFYRVFHNAFGALYGMFFEKIYSRCIKA